VAERCRMTSTTLCDLEDLASIQKIRALFVPSLVADVALLTLAGTRDTPNFLGNAQVLFGE
jgi:hypothetical protein